MTIYVDPQTGIELEWIDGRWLTPAQVEAYANVLNAVADWGEAMRIGKALDPRLWVVRREGLIEITCSPTLEQAIVQCGAAGSMNEVRRLLKAGAVKVRDLFSHEPWMVATPRLALGQHRIRVGKVVNLHVIIPAEGMTFKFWSEFVRAEGLLAEATL